MTDLRVGAVFRGFCHGAFGRDSYDDKRVEAIGHDWVVVREISSGVVYLWAGSPEELVQMTECPCGCQSEVQP